MNQKTFMLLVSISYSLLVGSVFAQPAQEQETTVGERRDMVQDVAAEMQDNQQAASRAAASEKQAKQESEALLLLKARNAFWLEVLQTFMPILSAVGIAFVGWLQLKASRERLHMAQSINGMKTELVAVTRAAAFYEGAQLSAERHLSTPSPTLLRGQELSRAAEEAAAEAHRLAAIAAGEAKGGKAPAPTPPATPVSVDTITLKPGDTVAVAAEDTLGTKDVS